MENIPVVQKAKPKGMPKTVKIVLEDNDLIPPTGLFIGHNGRSFMLRTGEEVNVPVEILEILNHAVMSSPITDAAKNVIGYRDRMKYPYRLVS